MTKENTTHGFRYPVLGKVKYEDKNVKVNILLRVKYFEIAKVRCTNSECYVSNYDGKLDSKYNTVCPNCNKPIQHYDKGMFKIYGCCDNRAVNVEFILNCLPFLFKGRRGYLYGKWNYVAYSKSYESIVSGINDIDDFIKRSSETKEAKKYKRKICFEKRKPFPTEEEIRNKFSDYKSWKVAKSI
jgi:hypothetical protein